MKLFANLLILYMNISSFFIIVLLHLMSVTSKMGTGNQNKCGTKLLDDRELVPDSAFSASSSFEHKNIRDRIMDLSPKAARESYDKDNQEFAWCPKNKVSSDLKEYLEIDMGRLVVINFAQTRGRFAQGAGKEYIPFYKIQYRREVTEKWRLYKKFDRKMGFLDILNGPSDPFLDAYETLDPPIITRWIRIYPFNYETMRVCMKLQLFGCTFTSNVVEYRIPEGNEPKLPFLKIPSIIPAVIKIFHDSSYDGATGQSILVGGLGRLTDNKTGGNFLLNPSEAQNFVGWNHKYSSLLSDVTLLLWFRFDTIRNFSHVKLSGYENSTMKIAHPSKLEAKFSIRGETFSDIDEVVSSFPDSKSENFSEFSSPWIKFNLHNRIGQFIQLKLHFQLDWIILTEIDFISEKAIGFEIAKEIQTPEIITEPSIITDNPQSQIYSNTSVDAVYILTILLCILVGIIIAISVFWLTMRHKRNKRKKYIKKHELAFYSQNQFKTISISSNIPPELHQMSNSCLGKYTSGSLQHAPRPTIYSQHDTCMYTHNLNSQSCVTIPKQSNLTNENSIYTSIPGSDNDSSLSTDYMASSGANSSHPYAQTIPVTCPMVDFIMNQPQIIGNPLVEYFDSQPFLYGTPKSGLCSYDPEMFGIGNNFNQTNSLKNNESFPRSITFHPIEYNNPSIEQSFYPLTNNYLGSPLKNDTFLK